MNVFLFQNYRDALKDFAEKHLENGGSYRSLSKSIGFASPNYLQQILQKKRNLTSVAAKKLSEVLFSQPDSREYFICLVKLESPTVKDKETVLERMRAIRYRVDNKLVKDQDMHSSWLNQIVFESCKLKNFDVTAENLKNSLNIQATQDEIQSAIDLCLKKEWFLETGTPYRYRQNEIKFPFLDDVRRIDIQRSHLKFLEVAKHRINADLDEREFRGLTITCPKVKINLIKQRIRKFFDDLDNEIEAYGEDRDCLIRLQMCLFMISR